MVIVIGAVIVWLLFFGGMATVQDLVKGFSK
jgi:hypothetical protein